jgi:hypothetical protein
MKNILKNIRIFLRIILRKMFENNNISIDLTAYEVKNCLKLNIIGFVFLILLVLSIILNSTSIRHFYKTKLLKPTNFFMMVLLCLNLVTSLIEIPYIIFNSFNCKYVNLKKLILIKLSRDIPSI